MHLRQRKNRVVLFQLDSVNELLDFEIGKFPGEKKCPVLSGLTNPIQKYIDKSSQLNPREHLGKSKCFMKWFVLTAAFKVLL